MVDAKRRLGMHDTKVRCGCTKRGVFTDRHGNAHRMRMHEEKCQYHQPHQHGKSNMPVRLSMT